MNISKFIAVTTWASILLIIFGVLTGVFKNDITTWFGFGFFVIIGVLNWALSYRKS